MSIAHIAYEQRIAEMAEVKGRYRQAQGSFKTPPAALVMSRFSTLVDGL